MKTETGLSRTNVFVFQKAKISRPHMFYKTGVITKFVKFIGNHLYQSFLFNQVAGCAGLKHVFDDIHVSKIS